MAEEKTSPQVSMLVHREVLQKLDDALKEPLKQFLGSYIFIEFCKLNRDVSALQAAELDPSQENFAQLSKDMRLVWRFWTDLLRFAEELQPK